MHGRSGNQFFQYALAKKIQALRDDKLSIYFGRVTKGNSRWQDDLKYFNTGNYSIVENVRTLIKAMTVRQLIYLIWYLIRCKFIKNRDQFMDYQTKSQIWLNKVGLYWLINGDFSPIRSTAKNVFFCGHFEHYRLYLNMEEELGSLFTPKQAPIESNTELYKIIKDTESVCISIRRGDYLSSNNMSTYFLCDKSYFDRAIEVIKEKIPNVTLVFFSDDVKWVRDNFTGDNVYYETEGNPVWEKIRLMSACKHFIISNSTFSWWCQYLSHNRDNKIVISPKLWYVGKLNKNIANLIPEKWIQM